MNQFIVSDNLVGQRSKAKDVSLTRDRLAYTGSSALPLTPADVVHRRAFEVFVIEHADVRYREALCHIYERWQEYNEEYFEGKLLVPYLMFAVPNYPGHLADYSPISGFGGHSQIRIRESLLSGNNSFLRKGEGFAKGRMRFVDDVLLHEITHQYHYEITGKTDRHYKGHGPAFRDMCNAIGKRLGLPPVRVAKARGKDKALPSCAQWPHCVRPQNFYLGAYLRSFQPELSTVVQAEARWHQQWNKLQSAKTDQYEVVVQTLVAAAQEFADTWPGSEQEAAELYQAVASPNGGQQQLIDLFQAARALEAATIRA